MKPYKIILKASLIIFILGLYSCRKDYLEIVPKTVLSEESVFVSEARADLFLNDIYTSLPDYEAGGVSRQLTSSFWDEIEWFSHYYAPPVKSCVSFRYSADRGGITASTFLIYQNGYPASPFKYDDVTKFIRSCNFFIEMLEKYKGNFSDAWRTKRMAEVRILRVFFYHQLWMAYGGVPLVTKVLNKETMGDAIFQPSVSIKQLYEFMVAECSDAVNDLPNEVGKGHITKGAALALKAWIELFMGDITIDPRPAAVGVADPAYAKSAYQACANTCQQIMSLGKYQLFPTYNDMFLAKNNNNSESIWAYQHTAQTNPSSRSQRFGPYASYRGGGGYGMPTQELVNMYRMKNGLPITIPASGYNAARPYLNREPRFYESIIYDSTYFDGRMYILGLSGGTNLSLLNTTDVVTGYFRRKGIDPTLTISNFSTESTNFMFFRYAEVLLMYAEAKIKAGEIDQSVINAIDQIRIRGGIPALNVAYGMVATGMSRKELLDIIWQERVVELSWEFKGYWDLVRTRKAEIYLNQPEHGIKRATNGALINYEIHKNVWPSDKYYLWPFYENWLESNPVWMDPANQVDGRVDGQNPGY